MAINTSWFSHQRGVSCWRCTVTSSTLCTASSMATATLWVIVMETVLRYSATWGISCTSSGGQEQETASFVVLWVLQKTSQVGWSFVISIIIVFSCFSWTAPFVANLVPGPVSMGPPLLLYSVIENLSSLKLMATMWSYSCEDTVPVEFLISWSANASSSWTISQSLFATYFTCDLFLAVFPCRGGRRSLQVRRTFLWRSPIFSITKKGLNKYFHGGFYIFPFWRQYWIIRLD